ncbi:ribonuclease III domain-containing protein RNC1, chloroplastic [Selaginella moellendorffii]|uniref:ribonuclease III domain-containing protein RNC1, chloroplastic n=1 Tax=Selaginella moellendorffii TaxID=88036 RepID=UPI000D1D0C96|nr:ribonuclease III domain-containing protein RNC1, chloroplastic [Selaginella moellendorffii]|eukprot:XP_024536807.1 ribonuclease III domain-containing protein RNC1, chloroplastic [Selaginella moellendorffii]
MVLGVAAAPAFSLLWPPRHSENAVLGNRFCGSGKLGQHRNRLGSKVGCSSESYSRRLEGVHRFEARGEAYGSGSEEFESGAWGELGGESRAFDDEEAREYGDGKEELESEEEGSEETERGYGEDNDDEEEGLESDYSDEEDRADEEDLESDYSDEDGQQNEHEEEGGSEEEENEDETTSLAATRVDRPFPLPLVTGGRGPYPGPSRVDPRRRRGGLGQPVHRLFILKPPMSERQLARRILASPQLRLNSLPVLSSLLPVAPFTEFDKEWIHENMVEVKDILGYGKVGEDYDRDVEDDEKFWQHSSPDPKAHLHTFLYLAFQHEESYRAKRMRHTRVGHYRLAFLGEFVLDLAMAELLLQMYPRDTPASLRERAFAVTNKRGLERILSDAGLHQLAFPEDENFRPRFPQRCLLSKSVFLALIAAVYLSLGMSEVYKLLFETFAFDLDAKSAQPKVRSKHEDVDHVSADFEGRRLTWKDIAFYKPPEDALFAAPRLFRACVPPGMYRFRRNLWDVESRPKVMDILGYPLDVRDENLDMTEAREIELGLGLQLCFMHPSAYKNDHPRFCYERLEFIGSKIQDVVMAERLLMKHLDAPAIFLNRIHRGITINRICGRRLRMKRLHKFITYGEERQLEFARCHRLRNFTHSATQQALHGLGYIVYGKAEVRRLMFDVFEFEKPLPTQADFNDMLASQGRRFVNTLQPTY